MVAWESNPTLGALVADMGPYLGTDWPAQYPPLNGRFPSDAGEIDYYVLDPATDDYRTISSSPSGRYSDSYVYVNFSGLLNHGAYTDGSPGGVPAGAHIYVAWYDVAYSTVPAAPSVTPEALMLSSYASAGTLTPPTFHWGPWITPANQTFTADPSTGGPGGAYEYAGSTVSISDGIATPTGEAHGGGFTAVWGRSDGAATPFAFRVAVVEPGLGTSQYAQELHPGVLVGQLGFYNADPAFPAGAVAVEQERVWDHTDYAAMLAAVVGDIEITLHVSEFDPGSMSMEDVTVAIWAAAPAELTNYDTTFGYISRTAGPLTQTGLSAGVAAADALVTLPAGTTTATASISKPLSDFYTGMLPYRPDEAPSLRLNVAIKQGVDGADPSPTPSGYTTSGRAVTVSYGITVTYTPPRYRFQYAGGALVTTQPPLRQLQRGDGLTGRGPRQWALPTFGVRQGPGAIR